jgi:hypothetical protein
MKPQPLPRSGDKDGAKNVRLEIIYVAQQCRVALASNDGVLPTAEEIKAFCRKFADDEDSMDWSPIRG